MEIKVKGKPDSKDIKPSIEKYFIEFAEVLSLFYFIIFIPIKKGYPTLLVVFSICSVILFIVWVLFIEIKLYRFMHRFISVLSFGNDMNITMTYYSFYKEKLVVLSPDKFCFILYTDNKGQKAISVNNIRGLSLYAADCSNLKESVFHEMENMLKERQYKIVTWPYQYSKTWFWNNRLKCP